MRAPKRIEQKKIQEVASLLIPLQGQSILLPNVTVAEIIPGIEISINWDAPPDKRSYKVCFDLYKKLAPHHQPQ